MGSTNTQQPIAIAVLLSNFCFTIVTKHRLQRARGAGTRNSVVAGYDSSGALATQRREIIGAITKKPAACSAGGVNSARGSG